MTTANRGVAPRRSGQAGHGERRRWSTTSAKRVLTSQENQRCGTGQQGRLPLAALALERSRRPAHVEAVPSRSPYLGLETHTQTHTRAQTRTSRFLDTRVTGDE